MMKIYLRKAFAAGVMALCACACVSCAEEQKSTVRNREYDVMVMEPTSRKLNSVYSASIRGKQDIDIRPKVSGYITDIYVKEGSVVKKGQTLFVIDQVPYEAELQTAIANVDVAKAILRFRIRKVGMSLARRHTILALASRPCWPGTLPATRRGIRNTPVMYQRFLVTSMVPAPILTPPAASSAVTAPPLAVAGASVHS